MRQAAAGRWRRSGHATAQTAPAYSLLSSLLQ